MPDRMSVPFTFKKNCYEKDYQSPVSGLGRKEIRR